MGKDPTYALERCIKTRNLGLVTSLVLVPMVAAFMYIDHISPSLQDIIGWRIGALVPALLFLAWALLVFPKHPRLAVPLHAIQLTGLIVMMCGITAELATRPTLLDFGRSALISSLLVCIFAGFVFAGGARKYLFAILVPPLAAMGVYVIVAGAFLTQMEQTWLISNPTAMAVVLSILALYQERANVREFRTRSELGRAQNALRESEKKFHDLFDNAEVGMFRTRLDGSEIIDVNRSFLDLTGLTRQEMIGSPSAMHWAVPHDREEMMGILARDGRVTNYECSLVNARGEARSTLVSLRLFSDQGILEGSLIDITERKQAEEWLEVLRHSIDAAVDGAYWVKHDGSFFYANESAGRSLGYTREELLGLRVGDVNPRATPEKWTEIWKTLEKKIFLDVESMHRRKDGSMFPVQVTTSFVSFGSQNYAVGFAHDISERKQAEAERRDLERRMASAQKLEGLGILAGGVAHNFNNLLTVILGHAELLREARPGDAAASASVMEIIKAGYRSRDLIRQLLTLGRRQAPDLRPLDLNAVVMDCRAMLRQALRENIAIEYRLSPAPAPVAADPGRIEEILLNLALNAQDAISQEGRLEIATTEIVLEGAFVRRRDDVAPGRYVLLTVSDTGEGIDGETVTKIFDPFFTTKEQGKGTGLGLSTVYGIVKQHNGSIEVESRPGAGTRFRIYLPRTEAPAGVAVASENERPG